MKKIFEIEWRLDDINQHDILLALKRHNPIWQVLDVTELKPEPKEEYCGCIESDLRWSPSGCCIKCGKMPTPQQEPLEEIDQDKINYWMKSDCPNTLLIELYIKQCEIIKRLNKKEV